MWISDQRYRDDDGDGDGEVQERKVYLVGLEGGDVLEMLVCGVRRGKNGVWNRRGMGLRLRGFGRSSGDRQNGRRWFSWCARDASLLLFLQVWRYS